MDLNTFLGNLRSTAAQLKQAGKVEDEEEAFQEMVRIFCFGISTTMGELVGPEKTVNLLNIFSNGRSKNA